MSFRNVDNVQHHSYVVIKFHHSLGVVWTGNPSIKYVGIPIEGPPPSAFVIAKVQSVAYQSDVGAGTDDQVIGIHNYLWTSGCGWLLW